jgi:hypothetical protein
MFTHRDFVQKFCLNQIMSFLEVYEYLMYYFTLL